ncbi:hypothetical protein [Bacillus sp. CGMCC 1.16541]|uniref:hypothetical protein n=1 Tax=Bacillus sp. CGMCC 1.16541 TaxID=2185143 RepID=UPI000D734A6F|nr:hypothetical protein [Bacillus sp. CGMCC 1.16541]
MSLVGGLVYVGIIFIFLLTIVTAFLKAAYPTRRYEYKIALGLFGLSLILIGINFIVTGGVEQLALTFVGIMIIVGTTVVTALNLFLKRIAS